MGTGIDNYCDKCGSPHHRAEKHDVSASFSNELLCKLCGSAPSVSKYRTDGGGFCTRIAKIECDCCGVAVIKNANDYRGHGGTGWDIAESTWKQAMSDAKRQWGLINT